MRNTLTVAIAVVCIKAGSGLLSQKPQDSVTAAGKSTYFNCSTSEPLKRIEWYHYHSKEVQRESIYRYYNFTEYWYPCYRNGRYVVEGNKAAGTHNLLIPTVVSSDAGRFLCEVDDDDGLATLTLQVDSSPVCVASEICNPYIEKYSAAIICIFLIILPAAIGGTIFVLWYLRVYRLKKRKEKVTKEADAKEEMTNTNASSQELELELEQLMHPTNDHETNTNELEDELKHKDLKIKALEDQLQKHLDEIRKLQKRNNVSDIKIGQLKAKVQDLEQRLYPAGNIDYAEKPTLAHKIITDAGKQRREPINGMTILVNELFVSHENTLVIEVYDIDTFLFGRNWMIEGMSQPIDIASSKIANCIYIIFLVETESESRIMKLDPKGRLLNKWPTGGEHGRLSTYESSVIVCLFEKQVINEFSGDGNLIRAVCLSPAVGFNHPWHAIKVGSSHFVVCHGDAKDELHRVCIIDAHGIIVKELKEWESKIKYEKLNVPICLVEDSERSILVADRDNQKIRLLNSFLKLQRNLVKQERGLDGYPVRICLEEKKGHLFVAVNTLKSSKKELRDSKILIFNII